MKRCLSLAAVSFGLALAIGVSFAWTATAAWHGFDYAEYWSREECACIDLRSAEVVQEGGVFVFTLTLYGDPSADTLAERVFGFQITMGGDQAAVRVEARSPSGASSSWEVRIGRRDNYTAELQYTALRTATVDLQEHEVSSSVPVQELGAPLDFSWHAYSSARASSGDEEAMDRIPDSDGLVRWSAVGPEASCPAFDVVIGSHRASYEIGDEIILMLYASAAADVRVWDTAGGRTMHLFSGSIPVGESDLKDFIMPGGTIRAAPQSGPTCSPWKLKAVWGAERRRQPRSRSQSRHVLPWWTGFASEAKRFRVLLFQNQRGCNRR